LEEQRLKVETNYTCLVAATISVNLFFHFRFVSLSSIFSSVIFGSLL
jgi:hypothetical protein